VVGVVTHIGSGRDPLWLEKAAIDARKLGATLLAATTDRFIRNCHYRSDHKKLWKAQATTNERELLALSTNDCGVSLMTFLDPDATPEECRSLLTRWGKEASEKNQGRPPKRNRERYRKQWSPRVMKLHEEGMSLSKIARRIFEESGSRISHTAIRDWIIKYSESRKLSGKQAEARNEQICLETGTF
jgi:hypothetical protein